jgi:hypothetical protein|tara:strand:+ start:3214 stop:3315 length:102 start_codon:yes stop_codon:yes gene_type:complete
MASVPEGRGQRQFSFLESYFLESYFDFRAEQDV